VASYVEQTRPHKLAFNTVQLGGVTLTASILYLSVAIHRQTRARQADLLRQQDVLFRNIVDPQPPLPPPTVREERAGLMEQAKDMWNAEIEGLVRRAHNTDWAAVRAGWERKITHAVSDTVKTVRENVPTETNVAQKREG
jgi:altered-inheritance-of-mitochondria protein 5